MAREPVVAVDFLGLGKSLRERDNELKAEKERGKLVKPMASHTPAPDQSPGIGAAGEGDREISLAGNMIREKICHVGGSLSFSLSPEGSWGFMVGKGEEADRTLDEKPWEDHSDADIKQMQNINGRGVHRPAVNNNLANHPTNNRPQAMKPMMSFRGLIEARQDEEKSNRKGGSPVKNSLSEAPSLSGLSAPLAQPDVPGPSGSASGGRNGFQAPRYNPTPQQASLKEEPHGGARPSERSVHGLESNLSLAIPSTREQPPAQSSGFGSPLPTFLRMLKPPDHSQRSPQVHPSGQASGTPVGSVSRAAGQHHLPGRPPTAQLTIFYAGMVNVYDDVPADKAQAIMLLAGSGSSWSSSCMNPPPSVNVRPPPSTGGMASSSNASAPASPAPVPAQGGAATPVNSSIQVPAVLKQVPGRPTLHAELPQARKASLARFLEKRKDRVRGKAPYMTPTFLGKKVAGDGSSTPPREKSPSPGNGKIRTRSPSPVNVVPLKRSPSPASRPGPSQASGSETSSPSRQLATPQPTSQPSTSEDQAVTTALRRPSKEEDMDWATQQAYATSHEQKLEPMEEVAGSPSQWH